ncbi:MAG: alanine--tRNA ligase, partial [Bacteroidia bacterium]|nr:alanine--tRNA ligase [Bacteroidia bacterium]
MKSEEIRQVFLNYFKSKNHEIVPSAPMVMKNDPTLMFTNAGMNQFKDLFLGNSPIKYNRIADTQKCLRVSGKHNDLEEVGVDTYHHTMFEMLGNWSFGDYFKEEAIDWAWDLLVNEFKINKENLYATVFEGDKKDGTNEDSEAYEQWKKYLPEDRILKCNKKDNFWEMGDTGPCGPSSEIHVDIRSDDEKKKVDGSTLVNVDHPHVIEIWNLVFIQYNRLSSGKLEPLPAKHVDTGMGFERLCMVLQNKKSNYDTDVFAPLINHVQNVSGKKFGQNEETDIAIRVMVDHIRAIAFSIADGQLPSNNKAGYVIRRILRRAVRYSYTYLDVKEPILFSMVPVLAKQMQNAFPELKAQEDLITKVIQEEESSFLKTLETGLKKFENYKEKEVKGEFAFELYDTYGFPIDLTQLIAKEKGKSVDMDAFHAEMKKQKDRSRKAAASDTGDWIEVNNGDESEFVGYDQLECEANILKYRKVTVGKKDQFQIVLNKTPFYAESGGQVGDTGYLELGGSKIEIIDTQKENNLFIHFAKKIPGELKGKVKAIVNKNKRNHTIKNHSVTHLLHSALKQVLGDHVAQKGSLVNEHHTRFDFSHFEKVTDEQLTEIEKIVNSKIQENIAID